VSAATEGTQHAVRPIAAYPMAVLLSEHNVIVEGSAALDGVRWKDRKAREHRLQ